MTAPDAQERERFETAMLEKYNARGELMRRSAMHPDDYAETFVSWAWKGWQAALTASPESREAPARTLDHVECQNCGRYFYCEACGSQEPELRWLAAEKAAPSALREALDEFMRCQVTGTSDAMTALHRLCQAADAATSVAPPVIVRGMGKVLGAISAELIDEPDNEFDCSYNRAIQHACDAAAKAIDSLLPQAAAPSVAGESPIVVGVDEGLPGGDRTVYAARKGSLIGFGETETEARADLAQAAREPTEPLREIGFTSQYDLDYPFAYANLGPKTADRCIPVYVRAARAERPAEGESKP